MAPKDSKEQKKQQQEASQPILKLPQLVVVGNQEYIPEPPLLEEKAKIYAS